PRSSAPPPERRAPAARRAARSACQGACRRRRTAARPGWSRGPRPPPLGPAAPGNLARGFLLHVAVTPYGRKARTQSSDMLTAYHERTMTFHRFDAVPPGDRYARGIPQATDRFH